jgi:hypothetical protein
VQHSFKKLRRELKYYIHVAEYHALRSKLSAVLKRDKYALDAKGYHIRSLYFDDLHDTALLEKNYGLIQRKKYRIRIYNKHDARINLERKSRFGEYVSKESVQLSRQEYQSILQGNIEAFKDSKEPLLQQLYIGFQVHRLRPAIIVDYTREAYTAAAGDVRVTFDKALSAVTNTHDVFDEKAVSIPVLLEPTMIMEVKYSHFIPSYISDMLHIPSHQRAAISKYVICRERAKAVHSL